MKKILLASMIALALAACDNNTKTATTNEKSTNANVTVPTNSASNVEAHSNANKASTAIDDTAITTAVKAKIAGNSELSVFKISVETKNGVVTLTGSAPTVAAAGQATALARSVENVQGVNNNIAIDASATPLVSQSDKDRAAQSVDNMQQKASDMGNRLGDKIDDAKITTAIKAKIINDDELKATRINVDTTNGAVSLSGDAPNKSAKDRAETIAHQVNGVTSVSNNLTLKP